VTGAGKMIKAKKWEDWAEDHLKIMHYTRKFLAYNDEFQEDCKNLSSEEVCKKWGYAPLTPLEDNQSLGVFAGVTGIRVHPLKEGTTITIDIDLETPISVLAHDLIDKILLFKRTKSIKNKKIEWEKLDTYIEVLELLKKEKDIDEIAQEVYPNDYAATEYEEMSQTSLRRKVKRDIAAAKEIIKIGHIW
jgi:hypothetical protein